MVPLAWWLFHIHDDLHLSSVGRLVMIAWRHMASARRWEICFSEHSNQLNIYCQISSSAQDKDSDLLVAVLARAIEDWLVRHDRI